MKVVSYLGGEEEDVASLLLKVIHDLLAVGDLGDGSVESGDGEVSVLQDLLDHIQDPTRHREDESAMAWTKGKKQLTKYVTLSSVAQAATMLTAPLPYL